MDMVHNGPSANAHRCLLTRTATASGIAVSAVHPAAKVRAPWKTVEAVIKRSPQVVMATHRKRLCSPDPIHRVSPFGWPVEEENASSATQGRIKSKNLSEHPSGLVRFLHGRQDLRLRWPFLLGAQHLRARRGRADRETRSQ